MSSTTGHFKSAASYLRNSIQRFKVPALNAFSAQLKPGLLVVSNRLQMYPPWLARTTCPTAADTVNPPTASMRPSCRWRFRINSVGQASRLGSSKCRTTLSRRPSRSVKGRYQSAASMGLEICLMISPSTANAESCSGQLALRSAAMKLIRPLYVHDVGPDTVPAHRDSPSPVIRAAADPCVILTASIYACRPC
jgi:hypothetical protein